MKRKTTDEYRKQIEGRGIIVLGEYKNNYTKLLHKCEECDNEWETSPTIILKGSGCTACAIKRTNEVNSIPLNIFLERIKSIHGDSISYIDGYTKIRDRINLKCNKCNHEWNCFAHATVKGQGCPHCNISKGENLIEQILKDNDITFSIQETFKGLKGLGGGLLRYDFYLPDYNTCIEFDGRQHFIPMSNWGGQSRLEETQFHDKLKDSFCINNDMGLIRVDYNKNVKIINPSSDIEDLLVIIKSPIICQYKK